MPYENPRTIAEVLDKIHRHEYVLPAIQREFVWSQTQIARLFDSMMRGYPIGSFLFWRVERENIREFRFYDFVRKYHQRDAPHCPPLGSPPDDRVIAVLDGQQRLTALNIALQGSHAAKEPRKWWSNPDAFPEKFLYLNLLGQAEEDNEEGMLYDFRFLTPKKADQGAEGGDFWFSVSEVLGRGSGPDLLRFLGECGLDGEALQDAYDRAYRLHSLIHEKTVIHYYMEEEQDLDRVLDIFIRTNSGGTVLSYSDLLLSIATAQWETLPARERIHDLVDRINDTRFGFSFSKDFVLKAGLMLADISSVGFKVSNFNRPNMLELERRWEEIERAIEITVRLAANYGFSRQTLSADSALLPIAYYLYRRGASVSYLNASSEERDRSVIRSWLIRSLVKPGVWGSGLDSTLTAIRTVLREEGGHRFPGEEIERAMARRGRSLKFDEEEIEDLVEAKYSDRRAFALLALLYPFVDLRNEFHVDHIFPQRAFRRSSLREVGLDDEQVELWREWMNRLPNLQLLEGPLNQGKQDKLPSKWLDERIQPGEREDYCLRHDMTGVPDSLAGFGEFFKRRRDQLLHRLRDLLADYEVGRD